MVPVLNSTAHTLTWKFHRGAHNDWIVTVATSNFDLHQPSHVPDGLQEYYNVTVTNNTEQAEASGQANPPQDGNVTTVTLNVLINDRLVEEVPYVFCILYRDKNPSVTDRSKNVSFIIVEPTTTTGVTTMATTERTFSLVETRSTTTVDTAKPDDIVSSASFGSRQSLHALGLSFSLLITIIFYYL